MEFPLKGDRYSPFPAVNPCEDQKNVCMGKGGQKRPTDLVVSENHLVFFDLLWTRQSALHQCDV